MRNVLDHYRGRVLTWRERNGYDDSDFLALVQADDGKFSWIEYASTRYYGGCYAATPDATEEVLSDYRNFWEQLALRARNSREERESKSARLGTRVLITRSRKHKGQFGVVRWWGEDQFKSHRHVTHFRAGVMLESSGEMVFVPAEYLQVDVGGTWTTIVNACRYEDTALGDATPEEYVLSTYPHPDRLRK